MKVTSTKGNVALAALAATSLVMASGCSSTHKDSTASYWADPDYQTASTTTVKTTTVQASAPQTTSQQELTMTGGESSVIPLYKEDLDVSKRTVDAGTVRVKKIVNTQTVTQPVELRQDEIVIERQPASENASAPSGTAFQEQEKVIHLSREEPVVEKRVSSSGQVVVKARSTTEQQNVQGQVRSEDVAVEKSGNAENVTIGQGVQQSGEATGGAESPSGQSSGQNNSAGQYKSGQDRINTGQQQQY